MTLPCPLKAIAKALIRSFFAIIVAFCFTSQVTAQVAGDKLKMAPARLMELIAAGRPQDLIVVFEDTAIRYDALSLQTTTGRSSRHRDIIEYKAGRYEAKKKEVLAAFASHEATVLKHYSHIPVGFVRVHTKTALDRLLAHPGVVGVFEDRLERLHLAKSLPLIGQPQAAAHGDLGTGTAVAVLDTGVDYTLAAFGSCTAPGVPSACRVAYAQDFGTSDGQLDADGHGTNVAGIVLGVAPSTKIIALDVFSGAFAKGSDVVAAMNWVIANKATYNIVAMNLSLGSGKYTSPETDGFYNSAVAQARAAGILTVVATGNDGYTNAMASPAAASGVVSVGAVYDSAFGSYTWNDPPHPYCSDATTAPEKVSCFSNSASFLTVLAPGCRITAGYPTGWCGTSQAAPHVAGAVAVLRASFPNETLDQTVTRLANGVMVTDGRNDITKPRLNLELALGASSQCTYSMSQTSATFGSGSASASIDVSTEANCTWKAASNTSWISVTSGSAGSGKGTVNYSVSPNSNVASRTGTLTIAGRSITITQSGSTATVANILINPGFEGGSTTWMSQTANGAPLIYSYKNATANNGWYGWLCGYDNCADHLYQDIRIPADAQSAYIQFDYSIRTQETSTNTTYDKMSVRVYSPPDAATYTYWTLSNLNATTGWVASSQYDVSAFRGKTIRLQFTATTDATQPTDFFLDNVNLIVSGSTPDTQAPAAPTGLMAASASTSTINLEWSASSDNLGVTAYRVYRDGVLLVILGNVTNYSDRGLAGGSTYTYTVAACDAAGNCSAQSTARTALTPSPYADTQPPSVPANFHGTATSTTGIGLSWAASSDNVAVTRYNLYRNGILLANLGSVTSYGDTGLTPLSTYSYTISACDAAGNCSQQSQAISVTTLSPFSNATPIVIDGSVSTSFSGNLVNISVAKITNRSLYYTSGSLRIELWVFATPFTGSESGYKTASIRTSAIAGASDQLAPNTSFTGLTLNLTYTPPAEPHYTNFVLFVTEYSLTCTTREDHFCYIYYVNLHEMKPPTVPTGVAATATSSSQVDLAWAAAGDNVGVATYKVYRDGSLLAILGAVTGYSDKGLAASTTYSYTVSACDTSRNCSAQSTAASATTLPPPDTQPPTVPAGLTATALDSTHIRLAWAASGDNVAVTAYKIYSRGTLVTTVGNVTSSTRTNAPSTTYSYTVAACDSAGNCSSQSSAATATTPAPPDTQSPTIPSALNAASAGTTAINVSWTAAADNVGVTSYKLYRNGTLAATLGNVTSYSDTGLKAGTNYRYTVVACDAADNCSAESLSAAATTAAPSTTTTTTTSTAATTTTTTSTTTTTMSGGGSVTLNLATGWNLLGNSSSGSLDIATVLGDTSKVMTAWKWIASAAKWAFYAPSLVGQQLTDHAATKGYDVLSTVNAGEGFWVNAKTPFTAQLPAGTPVASTSLQSSLVTGWNLIAVGHNPTPSEFNKALSATPPAAGDIPINVTTVWAWDNSQSAWYFYAPSLEKNGTLPSYIQSKGYLDFGTKKLDPAMGFWANKP